MGLRAVKWYHFQKASLNWMVPPSTCKWLPPVHPAHLQWLRLIYGANKSW